MEIEIDKHNTLVTHSWTTSKQQESKIQLSYQFPHMNIIPKIPETLRIQAKQEKERS
jgi:hypothetical protein